MSEETTSTPSSSPEVVAEPKPMPLNAKLAVMVAIILFLFMLQYTANGCARESIKMSWLGRTTSALAAAVAPSLLDKNPVRTRRLIEDIAREGRYATISVSDAEGKVIASTDRMIEGRVLPSMADAPDLPRILRQDGRLIAVRRIAIGGDNVIGAIRVEVAPD